MNNRYKYISVGLPIEMVEEIDWFIRSGKLGFRSRGEFVKEAVRRLIIHYKTAMMGGGQN